MIYRLVVGLRNCVYIVHSDERTLMENCVTEAGWRLNYIYSKLCNHNRKRTYITFIVFQVGVSDNGIIEKSGIELNPLILRLELKYAT